MINYLLLDDLDIVADARVVALAQAGLCVVLDEGTAEEVENLIFEKQHIFDNISFIHSICDFPKI